MNDLIQMCATGKYDTDKYYGHPWQTHSYIENFYNENFKPIKFTASNVLEIGTYTGGSILLWRDYFPNANILALDIASCSRYSNALENQERIKEIIGDAYSDGIVSLIPDNSLDIIVDDGPHSLHSFILFLQKYIPKLKKENSILVIEDISDSSWVNILMGYIPEDLKSKTKTVRLLRL